MKTLNKTLLFLGCCKNIILILILVCLEYYCIAQPGPPPGHGQNGDQGPGGMAPLGSGLVVFLLGSVFYGISKWRSARRKKEG